MSGLPDHAPRLLLLAETSPICRGAHFREKTMMAEKTASTRKRDRLRQWRSLLPGSSAAGPRAYPADTLSPSFSASKLPPPKPTSSPPLVASFRSSPQKPSSDSVTYSPLPAGQSVQPVPRSPTVANTVVCDFLNRALQRLSQQDRALIQEHILPTADDIDSVLLKAFSAAQDKQKLCERRRWTFTIGGHTLRLRDEADKVILWLDRFKRVGDIAVNADPMHAGLPWAAISLLLQVLNIVADPFPLF